MSKYVVEKGFAFTAGGIMYGEGDEISVEVFGGNKEAFSAAVAKGMIVNAGTGTDSTDTDTDTGTTSGTGAENASAKSFGEMSKEALGKIADGLKIDTKGKKKDEIATLVKAAVADFVKGADTATDEQVKEFALLVGAETDGKTKDEIISALKGLQG
ncbi:MAG: hypothetical protein ACTTKB_04460 [Treponema sp.]